MERVVRDPSVRERLRRRSRSQYGVMNRAQAREDGATDGEIRGRLDAGDWEVLFRNVYRHTAAPRCPEQSILGACLAVGPMGVASHESAAWLWDLLDQPTTIPSVTLPRPAHSTVGGIRMYRSDRK